MDRPQPETQHRGLGGLLHRARRPDRVHMEALRKRMPFWFVSLLLFAFAAIQIILNPFGFSDLTQRYTQDIANLLITGPYLYPETGRDRISVALVDDSTLSTLQMPWPWNYGAQARALDALLAYHPRAVVVDLLFVDPRDDQTLPELVDEIGRFKKANVPLYFVAATDVAPGTPAIRKEIAATGVKLVDPTLLINQGEVRQYPIQGDCFGASGDNCPSLALRVYADLYPKEPLAPLNGLMEIVWGTHPNPFNSKWMRVTDENGKPYSCRHRQNIGWMRRVYLAFFDPSDVRSQCPYEGIIPVESLIAGANNDADIQALAHDRIVFYGASLEGVQDKAFTPVNGMIAGVFTHAMALDNLITFHGQPQQNVVTVMGHVLDGNTVQMIAIVPVILIITWLHMLSLRRQSPAMPRERSAMTQYFLEKVLSFIWHWFAFGLALAAGLGLAWAAGLSVANWIEIVFVSVALAAMLFVNLPDTIWGYLHHVAGGVPDTTEKETSA
jgi:hypothetical protein